MSLVDWAFNGKENDRSGHKTGVAVDARTVQVHMQASSCTHNLPVPSNYQVFCTEHSALELIKKMTATDQDPKPLHGPEVEMIEKVGDNTSRDGEDNEPHTVGGVIPPSAREVFSDKGRESFRVGALRRV